MTVTAMPPTTKTGTEAGEKPGRKKKKIIVAVVLLLAIGAGGWFFFLKPAPVEKPVPGEVMTLEPVQLNLAGGHYLRLGMALQLVEGGPEVDGAKALDAAISLFSGLEVADVARNEQREELRKKLMESLQEKYHDEVLEVYFTEFVTQ